MFFSLAAVKIMSFKVWQSTEKRGGKAQRSEVVFKPRTQWSLVRHTYHPAKGIQKRLASPGRKVTGPSTATKVFSNLIMLLL